MVLNFDFDMLRGKLDCVLPLKIGLLSLNFVPIQTQKLLGGARGSILPKINTFAKIVGFLFIYKWPLKLLHTTAENTEISPNFSRFVEARHFYSIMQRFLKEAMHLGVKICRLKSDAVLSCKLYK